jgi:hypothetical protein
MKHQLLITASIFFLADDEPELLHNKDLVLITELFIPARR